MQARRETTTIGLTLFTLALTAPALAQEVGPEDTGFLAPRSTKLELRVGVTSTDNAFRTPANKASDELASAGISVDYLSRRPQTEANVKADIDYINYLEGSYSSDARGFLDGFFAWNTPNDLFRWTLQDTFGQMVGDPLAAVTPGNLENVNYLTTGPQLNFSLSSVDRLTFFGTYSKATYEKSPFDYDSRVGGLSLVHRLSADADIGLNALTQHTDYDESSLTGFDTREASVRFNQKGARTNLSVDVGVTQLEPDNGEKSTAPLVRLNAERKVSSASVVYVNVSQQYSTAGDQLRGEVGSQVAPGSFSTVASSDPLKQKRAEIGWNFERSRTGFRVSAARSEDEYQTQTFLNRKATEFVGDVTRRMAPTLTGRLFAAYRDYDQDGAGATAKETDLGLELTKYFGRTLGLAFRYGYYKRDSDVVSSEYTENRIGLRLSYYPGGLR